MLYFQICITVFPKQFKFSLIFEHLLMYLKKDDVLGECCNCNDTVNIETKKIKKGLSVHIASVKKTTGSSLLVDYALKILEHIGSGLEEIDSSLFS